MVFAHYGNSVWIGLLGAIVIGLVTGMIIAFSSLTGKTDLYLTCIAFNLMATGGTVFVMYLLTGEKSTTSGAFPRLCGSQHRHPPYQGYPGAGPDHLGPEPADLSGGVLGVPRLVLLKKTRIGLRIRAVGENPKAAESVGISVPKIGYISFAFCGVFAGLSGAFLSMSWVQFFMKNMANGRGYIGLSAQNMANGEPVGSALAALLFGFTDSLSITLKNQTKFPTEFLNMIPYLATIFAIIITSMIAINKKRKIEKGMAKGKEKGVSSTR